MMKSKQIVFTLSVGFLSAMTSVPAHAWGGRGHALICEAATRLVQDPDLAAFLLTRPHIMGHLCNIPDIFWKSTDEMSKASSDSHFVDPELVGKTPATLTTNYAEAAQLVSSATGQPIGRGIGTLWWRADQFYRLGSDAAAKAKASPLPTSAEAQLNTQPYNEGVYTMMVSMGLLGHFVGDASMPLHNSADYDAAAKGHAGLHSFYEERVVAELPLSLTETVRRKASPLRSDYRTDSVVQRMQRISVRAYSEIDKLVRLDKITVDANGRVNHAVAKEAARVYEPMIVREMADSAAQLAAFWDEMYIKGGRPNLAAYRSYLYPFTPDLVVPDYLDIAPPPVATQATQAE